MIDAERGLLFIGIWLAAVSGFTTLLTLYDKRAARRGARRVPEHTLLLVSAIGGSAAMLATMRIVRHKTKHAKFMVGIPVMIAAQVAVGMFAWWWFGG
ncbi:MAG: DUF1294 domain-containing protein [Clostridiales bacterium]|nr:DUF1294 domain-containing protein [Clostridiales bacterium]